MSGRLYHSAKGSLCDCLHLEPGRRSLLLGKSYALAMGMVVTMCLLGMCMRFMGMSFMRMFVMGMSLMSMIMLGMTMLFMCMMLFGMRMMLVGMLVSMIALLATARRKYQCSTYASSRL